MTHAYAVVHMCSCDILYGFCVCSDFRLLCELRMSHHTNTITRDSPQSLTYSTDTQACCLSVLRSHDSAFSLLLHIISHHPSVQVMGKGRHICPFPVLAGWPAPLLNLHDLLPLTGWMLGAREATNSCSSSVFLTTNLCWLGLVGALCNCRPVWPGCRLISGH